MELLIEFILELAFEGTLELSTSRKIPNWIRYPLIVLIGLFFAAFIGLILLIGLLLLQDMWYFGIVLLAFGLIFAVCAVRKFRKVYILKKSKWH